MKCLLCGENINKIIAKELRGGERHPVFYCKKCDLGMLKKNAVGDKLKKYYDKSYRKTISPKLGSGMNPKELFLTEVEFQNQRISALQKHLGKNKKLLEVGCSAGMFLWHARKYVKEAVGIDYDNRSAKYAAKKCRCKTYDKDIEHTDLKKNYFDIICVFQTLEHVDNPTDFIIKYKKYLKPNGVMAIEVPNIHSALLHAYKVPFYEKFYFPKYHLWYFSAKSLEKLMSQNDFRGKTQFLQDFNILNHMNWIFRNAPQLDFMSGRRQPVLPIRKNISTATRNKLNDFIQTTDKKYKQLLSRLGIASNLFYVGRLSR